MSIERYSNENSRNGFAPFGTLANTTLNGGKGSGNFGHEGRPGKVGGSGKGKGSAKSLYALENPDDYQKDEVPDIPLEELTERDIRHLDTQVRERLMEMKEQAELSSPSKSPKEEKERKGGIDPNDTGTYSLMTDDDGNTRRVRSMGHDAATAMLLSTDVRLRDVAKLPYDKEIKKEADAGRLSKAQTMAEQAIAGVGSILMMQAGEIGKAMSFVDKDFDYDNFDTQMQRVDEFLFNARKSLIGDSSKVGKELSKAIDVLERSKTTLQDIANPDLIKYKKEPIWTDFEDILG